MGLFDYFKKKPKKDKKPNYDYLAGQRETDLISKMYDSAKTQRALHGGDIRDLNPAHISRKKEYERQKDYAITFQFFPKHQNFRNVRSALAFTYKSIEPWGLIRDAEEKKNKGVCEICYETSQETSNVTYKVATECHEFWSFNGVTRIQKLERLMPLCNRCHSIVHILRFPREVPEDVKEEPRKKGEKKEYVKPKLVPNPVFEALMRDYCDLNKVTRAQAEDDFNFAVSEKVRRENVFYELEMSLINEKYPDYPLPVPFLCHSDRFNGFLETEFKNKSAEIEE